MSKPLVSIGIAAYNRPDGLRKALECLRIQSYANLEIIVSDDCSRGDEIRNVVSEAQLSDRRVRFYRQEKNIGAVKNYGFVLEKASGKYFFWADDEDTCEADFVEKIVQCMESQPDLVACGCDVKTIDQHDTFIQTNHLNTIRPSADWRRVKNLFFHYPTSNIFFCVLGIFRTDILKKSNANHLVGWNGYTTNGEVPFLAQIATFGRIAAIPEVLKTYRINPGSLHHAEVSSISRFNFFMLRLTIRMRLCRIVVDSNFSMRDKLVVAFHIFLSLIRALAIKAKNFMRYILRLA